MIDLKKYSCISFDLFDTLVNRNVLCPNQIFEYVGKTLQVDFKINPYIFADDRVLAEKKVRKIYTNEITLELIYRELQKKYKIDFLNEAKKLEIDYEIAYCSRNIDIFNLYQECINQRKIIIITSDMYLPYEVIETIINNCGYKQYYKIYLSSKFGYQKKNGTLFKFILSDLGVSADQILHIGDSYLADYVKPREIGLNAYYYKREISRKLSDNSSLIDIYTSKNRNMEQEDILYSIGYCCLGPILYGFVKYLKNIVDCQKIDMILFLSRDGKIVKSAWNLLLGDSVKNCYFEGSRKAFILPSLSDDASLSAVCSMFSFHDVVNLREILNIIGCGEFSELLAKSIDIDKKYNSNEIFTDPKIIGGWNVIKMKIEAKAKLQRNFFNDYVRQKNILGRCLVVDIGWNGTMQKAITKLIGNRATILGAYVAMNPNNKNQHKGNMFGFFCDKFHDVQNYEKIKSFGTILESFFTADHGSVIGYIKNAKSISPVFAEYEYKNSIFFNTIQKIQEAGLNFVDDFSKYFENRKHMINVNLEDFWAPFQRLCISPNFEEACTLGKLPFYNDRLSYLAKIDSFSPVGLYKALKFSQWKIGVLRQLHIPSFVVTFIYSFVKKFNKNFIYQIRRAQK